MIVPSIDLRNGTTVQLRGGREHVLDAGDPVPLARGFGRAGEIAVVDLDAALGEGENTALVESLLTVAPCRVGGGIRDAATAIRWLDAGATRVVLGTAAVPGVLRELPRDRVIAALDAEHGEVVVEGWRRGTGRGVVERMAELREMVGEFLVTFVEREGRMTGIDLAEVEKLKTAAGSAGLTVAGGISTVEEIAALDALGVDAQVGMALYTGRFTLADAFAAPLLRDRPGELWPTVICDEQGTALGLAWSDRESLNAAMTRGRGIYHSRSRGLWVKGETSGATQELLAVDLDCDRDALRFTVRQEPPGFCHRETRTCWGPDRGLSLLARRLARRMEEAPAGSYTRRLFDEPDLLRAKLVEEAGELAGATEGRHAAEEAADLFYFALTTLARWGTSLAEVEEVLDRRSLRLTRRRGDAKPGALAGDAAGGGATATRSPEDQP